MSLMSFQMIFLWKLKRSCEKQDKHPNGPVFAQIYLLIMSAESSLDILTWLQGDNLTVEQTW